MSHRPLHRRPLAAEEPEAPAAAELGVALGRLVPRLGPARPELVSADHGLRMGPESSRFVHGGPSVLERTVPVLRFEPGS